MKALKAECAGPRFWLGWGGWDKLAWGCEARCPQTGLLTGGLCGLRTAPRCEEMQHYMQRQDLRGDPRASSNELPAKSTVLRQTCHYVGTALSASAFPSGPRDGPRPLLTCPRPPTPTRCLAKGIRLLACWSPADHRAKVGRGFLHGLWLKAVTKGGHFSWAKARSMQRSNLPDVMGW